VKAKATLEQVEELRRGLEGLKERLVNKGKMKGRGS
jgi:hypothetical protein